MATFSGGEQLKRVIRKIRFNIPPSTTNNTVYTVPAGIYVEMTLFRMAVDDPDPITPASLVVLDNIAGVGAANAIYSSDSKTIPANEGLFFNMYRIESATPPTNNELVLAHVVKMVEGQELSVSSDSFGSSRNIEITMELKEFVAPGGLIDL